MHILTEEPLPQFVELNATDYWMSLSDYYAELADQYKTDKTRYAAYVLLHSIHKKYDAAQATAPGPFVAEQALIADQAVAG